MQNYYERVDQTLLGAAGRAAAVFTRMTGLPKDDLANNCYYVGNVLHATGAAFSIHPALVPPGAGLGFYASWNMTKSAQEFARRRLAAHRRNVHDPVIEKRYQKLAFRSRVDQGVAAACVGIAACAAHYNFSRAVIGASLMGVGLLVRNVDDYLVRVEPFDRGEEFSRPDDAPKNPTTNL